MWETAENINKTVEAGKAYYNTLKLGCYYFNNWVSPESWSTIKYFGKENLEPILGFYRDGSPEVQEWHIRQAKQHGISFWVFDWYYDVASRTVPAGDAALDIGFLNAQSCSGMEFAIMWCNEEPDVSGWSEESLLDMTKIICERYLSKSNYLKTPDGRNYFEITRPDRLIDRFGLEKTNEILKKMNDAASGYGGFYYVAIKYPTDADAAELKAAGFDALTLYSYNNDGAPEGAESAPYDLILPAVEPIIRHGSESGILPLIPCVSPNWDSRPWAGLGGRGSWRTGSTPELFGEMCSSLAGYADPELNMMLVGTWNEFGEGSHIEPTVAKGCRYLDAMQKALFPESYTEHDVMMPCEDEKQRFDFPDIPPVIPEKEADGNLVINPVFERGYGWELFSSGDMEYSPDCISGSRSLMIASGTAGVKSKYLIGISRDDVLEIRARVKGRAHLRCALFDTEGDWQRRYCSFGKESYCDTDTWTFISGKIRGADIDAAYVDVEIVSDGNGDVLVDMVEARIQEECVK